MPNDTLTPRERWLAVLSREKPDRVPMDYRATSEATHKLMAHLGCANTAAVYERLHIDRVVSVGPRYVGPPIPPDQDVYGCGYTNVDYGTGVYRECVTHPLAEYESVAQIERHYTWPNPDWWDYSGVPAQLEGNEAYPIRGGGSEPFLTYKYLRGDEQARGQVTMSYVAEDLGSQESLLYSPGQIREFLLPRMTRMMDLAHQAGAFVFHHSDGAVRDILPDMIDAGIDVLDPVQWRCKGMEREGLKRDFGDRLIFHGAMDNQYTLAFGSEDEVRQEVIDNLRILGDGGGYIISPCHNIQAVSPPENIVAMYEAGYEHGWT